MSFFVALFVEYFWVREFLFLFGGVVINRRRGSGDDATSGVWEPPRCPIGYRGG